jgi:hypothetical protein
MPTCINIKNLMTIFPDGYVYAEFEEGGATTGFLQSINYHPLEAVSNQDENTVGVFGCLRFWYFIDSSEPAELMVILLKYSLISADLKLKK